MKNFFLVISFITSVFMLSSCEEKTEEFPIDFGYDYYPTGIGFYWNYKVDSTIYRNLGNEIDTTSSFIREEIVEKFEDQLGDTIFRIERYFNDSLNDDWDVTDEWALSRSETQLTRTEENLKFIKLVFPPKINKRWNGNAFVDNETTINVGGENLDYFIEWDYRILDQKDSEEIGGILYEDVLTVQSADNLDPDEDPCSQNLVNRRFLVEKYARNVGLIYRKEMILDTQCLTLECCESLTWEEKAEKGFIMEMSLVEHGK